MTSSQSSKGTGRVRSAQSVSAAPGADSLKRVVSLDIGQVVKATVVSTASDGSVVISAFGGRIDAFSGIALEAGSAYEFTVTKTSPKVVLSAAKPLVMPSLGAASTAGQLGASPVLLASLLGSFFQDGVSGLPGLAVDLGSAGGLRESLAKILSGQARGEDLKSVHRALGHDQEIRVASLDRLPADRRDAEILALQKTVKAGALQLLAMPRSETVTNRVAESAAMLVDQLNCIESENAQRAKHGGALLLPLPISAGSGMRDARMYLVRQDSGHDDGRGQKAEGDVVTIVLLLDLTRLGAVRVNVRIQGDDVTADFHLVDYAAAAQLRAALPELERGLGKSALSVEDLTVRHVPRGELPVADLVVPPSPGDRSTLVDLHV